MQKKYTKLFWSLGLTISVIGCSTTSTPPKDTKAFYDANTGDYAYCNQESCPQPTQFVIDNTPEQPLIYLAPESVPIIIQPTVEKITVNFGFAKAILSKTDINKLDDMFNKLKNKPDIKIKIIGYTDSVEGVNRRQRINQKLASARADVVKNYLTKKFGVSTSQIVTESKPLCCYVASNKNTKGRFMNRRSEVQITIIHH